jgi:hypothetical protein
LLRRVRNGVVSDARRVDVAGAEVLVVPEDASVIPVGSQAIELCLEKHVELFGHPRKPITPQTARRSMGVAVQREGTRPRFGTYGEWANIEGSAWMSLTLKVSSTLRIERLASLRGPESAAAEQEPIWWIRHRKNDHEWWYAAAVPAVGWMRVDTSPIRNCGAQ